MADLTSADILAAVNARSPASGAGRIRSLLVPWPAFIELAVEEFMTDPAKPGALDRFARALLPWMPDDARVTAPINLPCVRIEFGAVTLTAVRNLREWAASATVGEFDGESRAARLSSCLRRAIDDALAPRKPVAEGECPCCGDEGYWPGDIERSKPAQDALRAAFFGPSADGADLEPDE